MKVGSLVEMYGEPGFYGILIDRPEGECPFNEWLVLWQSGFIFEREETLLRLVQ